MDLDETLLCGSLTIGSGWLRAVQKDDSNSDQARVTPRMVEEMHSMPPAFDPSHPAWLYPRIHRVRAGRAAAHGRQGRVVGTTPDAERTEGSDPQKGCVQGVDPDHRSMEG